MNITDKTEKLLNIIRNKSTEIEEIYKNLPINYLINLGFKKYICSKCKKCFFSYHKRFLCGDKDCDPDIEIKKKLSSNFENFTDFLTYYLNFFKKDHVPKIFNNLSCLFNKNVNYVIAGINSFDPGYTTEYTINKISKFVNVQMCMRLNDIDNLHSGRHNLTFNMLGLHWFFNNTQEWIKKDSCFQNLLEFFKSLKFDIFDFIYHIDAWSDYQRFAGPSIQIFYNGIELSNMVFAIFDIKYEDEKLIFQLKKKPFIDMGAGGERIFSQISDVPIFNGDKILFETTKTLFFSFNSGFNFSKTFIGYNLKRLSKNISLDQTLLDNYFLNNIKLYSFYKINNLKVF